VSTLLATVFAPLKVAVMPAGNVPTVNATLPVKPFTAPIAMVEVPLLGRFSVNAALDGVSAKLGVPTVTATVVEDFKVPETPLTMRVYVPFTAVLPAVIVMMLLAVAVAALKAAVTPVGSVPVVSATLPLKPFTAPTAIVVVELPGRTTVTTALDGVKVKLGASTENVSVAVLLTLPERPVIVSGYVPATAVVPTVNVSVLEAAAVEERTVEAGLKTAVTPAGRPVTASPTVPVKPLTGVTVRLVAPPVVAPVAGCRIPSVATGNATLKPGAAAVPVKS